MALGANLAGLVSLGGATPAAEEGGEEEEAEERQEQEKKKRDRSSSSSSSSSSGSSSSSTDTDAEKERERKEKRRNRRREKREKKYDRKLKGAEKVVGEAWPEFVEFVKQKEVKEKAAHTDSLVQAAMNSMKQELEVVVGARFGAMAAGPVTLPPPPPFPPLPLASAVGDAATAGTHVLQAAAPALAAHQRSALAAGLGFLYKPPAVASAEGVVLDLAAKLDRSPQLGSAVKKIFDKAEGEKRAVPKARADRARAVVATLLGTAAPAAEGGA